MSEGIKVKFEAGAVGSFVRTFETPRDLEDWLSNLSDGDIRGEVEAGSGWDIKQFTVVELEQ